MKRLATATAAALLIAGPALAQVEFQAADLNNDEFLSLPEALTAYPDMDPTDFDRLDTDSNRLIDFSEANTGEATELFAGLERAEAVEGAAFDMESFDADQDGFVSFGEVESRIPGVPEVYFQDFDADSDGVLDSDELNSGQFQNLLNKYAS